MQSKIVYVDEVMFTKHTNRKRDWSSKFNNTTVCQTGCFTGYVAVVAAISKEVGNEVVYTHNGAIDQEEYIKFLRVLRKRNGKRHLVLFADNLSVHKTILVLEEMKKLHITPVFNAVYSPWYNPIETAFAKVKAAYKKDKLARLVHGKPLPMEQMIRSAFATVTRENISNYIEHSYNILRKAS